MKLVFSVILFFFCGIFNALAQQETLVPLYTHPGMNESSHQQFISKKTTQRVAALSLPFFDDFYQQEIYPDPNLWEDNFVFINTTFPKETVTVGVATFDGTNATGKPYSLVSNAFGAADKLTSNPIDLSGLSSSDNVYLSFYYLSGEFGEAPSAPNDIIRVQFADTAGNWNTMWQSLVDGIDSMRQIFIKVDTPYLNADFQFRFQSVGNLNGANDTWHIDYVKLDKNRDTIAEANIKEMAYEFLPPSVLKNYYVMPYHQFDSTDLADSVQVIVRNNFINATTDIVDFYEAEVVNTSTVIATFNGPSRDFSPLTRNPVLYAKFDIPLDLTDDTVVIKIDYRFDVSAEAGEPAKVLANNAVTHNQIFSNYFAYDDGTPERGYWVSGLDFYKMAVKYSLRNPDTLQAVKMKFLAVRPDNNLARFSVCVWKNFERNSVYNEDDLVYFQSGLKITDLVAESGTDTLNGYYYAPIKPQFMVNGATYPLVVSDTFAVGLLVEGRESLAIGFDRNNNFSANNFYVDGVTKWRQSDLNGTMMINPVVGKPLPSYLTTIRPGRVQQYDIKVFPNPAKESLFIEGVTDNSLIQLYSLNGTLVQQTQLGQSGSVSVAKLPAAAYVIRITNLKTNQSGTAKFIKSEY
jgi:hypothetical protein